MCGIAGIFDACGVDEQVLRSMVDRMTHRGPDGCGYYHGDTVGLGVRRLAIVDVEGGDQPLYNEEHDVVVVFNGEIYNHAELREWLVARGHLLSSHSDGAVLPHMYEELGTDFARQLNGIFAIALWDRRQDRLHLIRDHFGVKPLYWTENAGRVGFASELKALCEWPAMRRKVSAEAVDAFLTYRFVPSPLTMFERTEKVPPGSAISIHEGGIERWMFADEDPRGDRRDAAQLIEEYQEAFETAVMRQLMSDRPIGVMLSGGVDSGALTAVMAEHLSQVRTFSVGFAAGGEATNELPLAQQTARMFGTHHEARLISEAEYLRDLPSIAAHIEEPVGTSSALAVRYVSAMMKGAVPVALSGQGADEPLAGYWRHLGAKIAWQLRHLRGAARHMPVPSTWVRVRRGRQTLLESNDAVRRAIRAYEVFSPEAKRRLYRRDFVDALNNAASVECFVEKLSKRVSHLDGLGQMLFVDTRMWLPDELLLVADKMSMAESVELRVPFLDRDLVALVESAHSSLKVRGLTRKWFHKKAMLRWLPQEIVYRKERGWATPIGQWMRSSLRPLLTEALLSPDGVCRQAMSEAELMRLITDHASGRENHVRELFCLLNLALWHREFVLDGTVGMTRSVSRSRQLSPPRPIGASAPGYA
jgi:asparagine synthase (glutamine-hydrolysing)